MWTLLAQIHNKSNDGQIMSDFFFILNFILYVSPNYYHFCYFEKSGAVSDKKMQHELGGLYYRYE